MDGVWIEGVSEGVEVMGSGRLVMNMGKIEFTSGEGNYGVKVGETADATLMGTEIRGTGMGYGVYISGGAVMLSGLNISKVEKGVEVTNGRLKMNMGSITVKSGAGNGNYGVGVWVSGMATAHLTDVMIEGTDGTGKGTGVVMEGGTVVMDGVKISKVGVGVEVMGSGGLVMKGGRLSLRVGAVGMG
ncbi:hypothetical protein m02_10500 [Bartonella bovis m02]|uniref:Right handed beta helix domain-containing protein n=2 Tax=Bartonella bovis TaxID=155194 RepID=N6VI91_9HYPH|nr:hypothetical protein m02_10500 [Bartonella bovis m02]